MTYEIEVPSEITTPCYIGLVHDNPKSAKESLQELQNLFPQRKFRILRDGTPLQSGELDSDLGS
jgi:hypothetical protein